MARKPSKTPPKTAMRKPSHGRGMLRIGGTNKGGPGRPREEFKQLCRDMASGEMTMAALQEILTDRTDAKFVAALRYVTEYGYGKVAEAIDITSQGEHINKPQKVDWGALKLVV